MKTRESHSLVEVVKGLLDRYREIETAFQDGSVPPGSDAYRKMTREWRRLQKLAEPALAWERASARLEEAEASLADEEADEELKELAQADGEEAKEEAGTRLDEIRDALLTEEPLSDRNVILEIRAGTGGEEASLFALDLYKMYQRYAEARRWRFELLSASETDLGGFKEAVVSVEGDGVFDALRFESGGHRVQRVPETEAGGRIHTSACTVAVLPEPEEVEIDLDPEDLKIDTFRASGPGGQKVNKTSSAVRMTHLPTGLVVSCQDEKSQHKNRSKALKIMKSRLFELEQKKKQQERSDQRRTQIGSGDRSERVRTYNFPQNRVTDHRIKKNFSLQTVIAGDLADVVDALTGALRAERLSQMENGEGW